MPQDGLILLQKGVFVVSDVFGMIFKDVMHPNPNLNSIIMLFDIYHTVKDHEELGFSS